MKFIQLISALFILLPQLGYAHDVVLYKDGTPFLGVSYPDDWKQTIENSEVIAVSPEGLVWSALTELKGTTTLEEGETKIKEWLKENVLELQLDETVKTDRGSHIILGSGKSKADEVPVKIGVGIFKINDERVAAIGFLVDAEAEELYKTTVLQICDSVLVESDFE